MSPSPQPTTGADVAALVVAEGSGVHRHVARLADPAADPRDRADALHTLCLLHGRAPGVIEHARDRSPANRWFAIAAEAMAAERRALAALVTAAGPLPSTPDHARSHAALVGQQHALDRLARSDRTGCAVGAAYALAGDWSAIRRVIDAAAARFAVSIENGALPLPPTAADDRAIVFGARQLLSQHRGAWDLLEARAALRRS